VLAKSLGVRTFFWMMEKKDLVEPGCARGGGGGHLPGAHVERGQQGEGTVADVFMLDPHGLAGRGRGSGMAAAACLDGGLGVDRQDPIARP
jgi:hypothetical protein